MEQLADVVPMVQVLDFPVVLSGDRVMEVLRKLDVPSVEQVPAFCGTLYSDGGAVGGSADAPGVRACGGRLEAFFEARDPWNSLRTGCSSGSWRGVVRVEPIHAASL